MSMTEAERKRLSRRRRKEAERAAIKGTEHSPTYLKRPFSEFIRDRSLLLDENLDAFGVQIRGSAFESEVQDFPSEYERDEPLTALQRAVGLVDVFLDAAKELAHLVNVYKLEEVERAVEEASAASMALPRDDIDALKTSFAEIDRLKRIRSDLQKPTRHTVLGTTARGE